MMDEILSSLRPQMHGPVGSYPLGCKVAEVPAHRTSRSEDARSISEKFATILMAVPSNIDRGSGLVRLSHLLVTHFDRRILGSKNYRSVPPYPFLLRVTE
jgi:hypothetical protein